MVVASGARERESRPSESEPEEEVWLKRLSSYNQLHTKLLRPSRPDIAISSGSLQKILGSYRIQNPGTRQNPVVTVFRGETITLYSINVIPVIHPWFYLKKYRNAVIQRYVSID